MRIRVLYFAVLRERLHRSEEAVDVPDASTAGALLDLLADRHDAVRALRNHLQVARNQDIVGLGAVLADGDEVALVPPVSGGAALAAVRDAPLDLMEVVRAVTHEGAGGIVTFVGIVRRQSRGRTIQRLEYEAYREMADRRLAQIVDELTQRHPGAAVAILHRVGVLSVGDAAVVIAASAPHRAEAFAAARDAIERLKAEVPIWKKEVSTDGEEWIGLGP